jgi:hypothetical protein
MSNSPPETRPTVAWMQVLDRIEDTLDRSLARAAEPEAYPAALSPPPDERAVARRPLQLLDQRLAQMQACLDLAGRRAAEAEGLLEVEAQALGRWRESLGAARDQLADWAGRVAS